MTQIDFKHNNIGIMTIHALNNLDNKLIPMYIKLCADSVGKFNRKISNMTQEKMSRRYGLSVKTIRSQLKELEEKNMLIIHRNKHAKTIYVEPDVYEVILPKDKKIFLLQEDESIEWKT